MADEQKQEQQQSIADKLKKVMDPNAAMGKGAKITRTQEKAVARSLHGYIDPAVYDDEKNIIGYVYPKDNGRFRSELTDVEIGGESVSRAEAVNKVHQAHAARKTKKDA